MRVDLSIADLKAKIANARRLREQADQAAADGDQFPALQEILDYDRLAGELAAEIELNAVTNHTLAEFLDVEERFTKAWPAAHAAWLKERQAEPEGRKILRQQQAILRELRRQQEPAPPDFFTAFPPETAAGVPHAPNIPAFIAQPTPAAAERIYAHARSSDATYDWLCDVLRNATSIRIAAERSGAGGLLSDSFIDDCEHDAETIEMARGAAGWTMPEPLEEGEQGEASKAQGGGPADLPQDVVNLMRRGSRLTTSEAMTLRDRLIECGYEDATQQIGVWLKCFPNVGTQTLRDALGCAYEHASRTRNRLGCPSPRARGRMTG